METTVFYFKQFLRNHPELDLECDVDEIVNAKMSKNEVKYPVEKAKGSAAKYDQL